MSTTYLINRSLTAAIVNVNILAELWYKKKHDVSKLRVLGCTVFLLIPRKLRTKLDKYIDKMCIVSLLRCRLASLE